MAPPPEAAAINVKGSFPGFPDKKTEREKKKTVKMPKGCLFKTNRTNNNCRVI